MATLGISDYPYLASVAAMQPVRVMIAEDQLLLREGLGRLLAESGFEVVAQAADAPDLLRKVAAHHPDVAIAHVQMPPNHSDDGAASGDRDPPEPSRCRSPDDVPVPGRGL